MLAHLSRRQEIAPSRAPHRPLGGDNGERGRLIDAQLDSKHACRECIAVVFLALFFFSRPRH